MHSFLRLRCNPWGTTHANTHCSQEETERFQNDASTPYKRFIDDNFVIWEGPRETLLKFLSAINTKEERIKITYEISVSKISFLDLLFFKGNLHS